MTKVTEFNRTTCKDISRRVEELLKDLGDELGVEFKTAGGRFSRENYTMKIEVNSISEDGEVFSKEVVAFKEYSRLFGVPADRLGKEFVSNGDRFKLEGLNPRSKKYPFLARNLKNGKTYKFHQDTIKLHLG